MMSNRRQLQGLGGQIAPSLGSSCQTPESEVSEIQRGIVEGFRSSCSTPKSKLENVADGLISEMEGGLEGGSEQRGSSLKMLPTFVEVLPDGREKGLYYALDLGGTNFRVLRVRLGGEEGRIIQQQYEEVAIPQKLMSASGQELFDYIATKLADFVRREGDGMEGNELGFTFSFPVEQSSVDSGVLIRWTKGFTCKGVIGKDVVSMLEASMAAAGVPMKVTALVNDAVGTLAGGRYWNGDVMVAVILGTGTNACYVERADAVGKCIGVQPRSGETVRSLEWGNFCSPHLPKTYADESLDADSVNPGQQGFEKLLGGMYMGDVVRRVMLRVAEEADLFGKPIPPKLLEPHTFTTPNMSTIHMDESNDLESVTTVLRDAYGITSTSMAVRKLVYDLCVIVCERSARLAGAGIVGILRKIGRDQGGLGLQSCSEEDAKNASRSRTVVAIDGGLYEHYPKYRDHLREAVTELLGDVAAQAVTIELSKDGSGIGAALLAASHSHQRQF